jgi:hypothetical protein
MVARARERFHVCMLGSGGEVEWVGAMTGKDWTTECGQRLVWPDEPFVGLSGGLSGCFLHFCADVRFLNYFCTILARKCQQSASGMISARQE